MTTDIRPKEAVLKLLREGQITAAEAAWATGNSRQCIHNWAKAAGINYYASRIEHVRKLVEQACRVLA